MRGSMVAVALAATLALGGCSAMQGSEGESTQDILDLAVIAAYPACVQLADSIKPEEAQQLAVALAIVDGLLSEDPAAAELIVGSLIVSDPRVGPYAPAIARVVRIAVRRIPPELRSSLYGQAALDIVAACRMALPAST